MWNLNSSKIYSFCTAWRTGLRRIWNLPNTTHCDLLHLLSNDLPIFDELCRRSLKFIQVCLFHKSNVIKFVARHAVLFARFKSLLGSNFHFCARHFNFSEHTFYDHWVDVDNFVNQHCLMHLDVGRFSLAQFLRYSLILRDLVGRHGYMSILSRREISDVIYYLATS